MQKELIRQEFSGECELVCGDLNKGVHIENASVVLMVLTLQFIRPLYREKLIESIYHGMNENGCLIVVEKVIGEDSLFNRLFIKYYYDMKKKNGYSELEISQRGKRSKMCLYRINCWKTGSSFYLRIPLLRCLL